MKETNNILVTGNGFDLYHGLKTNYTDFITAISDLLSKPKEECSESESRVIELCRNNGFFRYFKNISVPDTSWVGFETELEQIIDVFINYFAVMEENKKDARFDIGHYSIFCESFSFYELTVFKQFFNIFEQIYDDMSGGLFKLRRTYITEGSLLDEKGIIARVKQELDDFTEALNFYLSTYADCRHSTRYCDIIKSIKPDYVINFNYTNTCQLYDIPAENIFYAKGRSGSKPLNMVLGIPDDTEDHLDFICFKNYFQSIIKFTGAPDRKKLNPPKDDTDALTSTVTHVFGYSLCPSDESIIRMLDSASDQVIIYYADQDDYAKKVINLIKIFGKNEALEKIQTGKYIFQEIPS